MSALLTQALGRLRDAEAAASIISNPRDVVSNGTQDPEIAYESHRGLAHGDPQQHQLEEKRSAELR
jgi:hypothetical protein